MTAATGAAQHRTAQRRAAQRRKAQGQFGGARTRPGGDRDRGLGRTGFALYLTGGTLAALIFLLPLGWRSEEHTSEQSPC